MLLENIWIAHSLCEIDPAYMGILHKCKRHIAARSLARMETLTAHKSVLVGYQTTTTTTTATIATDEAIICNLTLISWQLVCPYLKHL